MSYISPAENGNGSINGRGIKHRDLTHHQLVELAADAVSGVHPVVPSLSQAPKIFEGVSQSEVSEELKRREVTRKDAEADKVLFAFADAWSERPSLGGQKPSSGSPLGVISRTFGSPSL
jgi:hypothetical protein